MRFLNAAAIVVMTSVNWGIARAELDPELAQATIKNDGGFYLGGGLKFGQSYATGGSTPGLGMFAAVEPGYVARRDSWGRIEAGLELSTGQLGFRYKNPNTSYTVSVPLTALAKIGYGWSIGGSTFSVLRVGVGPSMASFSAKSKGSKLESKDSLNGLASYVGYDLIMPLNSSLDIVGGASLTHFSYDIGKIKADGVDADLDTPLEVNLIAIQVGTRFTF